MISLGKVTVLNKESCTPKGCFISCLSTYGWGRRERDIMYVTYISFVVFSWHRLLSGDLRGHRRHHLSCAQLDLRQSLLRGPCKGIVDIICHIQLALSLLSGDLRGHHLSGAQLDLRQSLLGGPCKGIVSCQGTCEDIVDIICHNLACDSLH